MLNLNEVPKQTSPNPENPNPQAGEAIQPHGFDLSDEGFQTNGRRQNDGKIFHLPFYGREIYYFLELLDSIAEKSNQIVDVRPAVLGAEIFRERAKQNGF